MALSCLFHNSFSFCMHYLNSLFHVMYIHGLLLYYMVCSTHELSMVIRELYKHTHAHVCTHTRTHMYAHTHARTHTHTYTHMHTHTHIGC